MGVLYARVGGPAGAWFPVGAGGGMDQATADALYVDVAGDIMTGSLSVPAIHDIGGDLLIVCDNGNLLLTAAGQITLVSDGGSVAFSGAELTEIANPSADTSAATKAYVDASAVADGDKGEITVTGGVWRIDPSAKHLQRFSVRAAALVSSPNMATDFVPGTVMDGVTLAQGDEILLMSIDPLTSGVWVVSAAGAPTRHPDMDATGDVVGGTEVFVREGTVRQGDLYVAVSTPQPWVPGVTLASWSSILTNVKGNSFYQVKDADLTTIAGLTATTDNMIQSVASAWASRTPAEVAATLPAFTTAAKGVVPAPVTATSRYLKDDGTWGVAITVSTVAPSSPAVNDLWVDTT